MVRSRIVIESPFIQINYHKISHLLGPSSFLHYIHLCGMANEELCAHCNRMIPSHML
jgi:hypothetical protein